MSIICIVDHGVRVTLHGGRIVVDNNNQKCDYPIETIEGILVFSNAQISSQCIEACLWRSINISYFSSSGQYYGSTISVAAEHSIRIKNQVAFCLNDSLSLELSKRIVKAKINNQIVVARRYVSELTPEINERLLKMKRCRKRIDFINSQSELRGYEGIASRYYFEILAEVVAEEFKFKKRQRPAIDPFNAMLNMGYSLLSKEIHGEIVNNGLSAYIGFYHSDKENHPALASDLIEEWRAPIVDSVVLSLIQNGEIAYDMFSFNSGKCIITNEVKRLFLLKLQRKMNTQMKYLKYIEKEVTFREGIWHQVHRFKRMLDCNSSNSYFPIEIR